jgi:hypothetical protein
MQGPFTALVSKLLRNTSLPPQAYLQIAQTCGNARRPDLGAEALKRCLERDPNNSRLWIELALMQLTSDQVEGTIASLRKAVEVGGEAARALLRGDNRFGPFRQSPQFRSLTQQAGPLDLKNMLP